MRHLFIFVTVLLSACVSADPISMHANTDVNFELLKRRLINTGAGLMRANAEQCPKTREIVTPRERFDICTVKVGMETSPIPNAHTNGNTIFVTTAMIEALSLDELAFIIAHELAHTVAGHDIENGSYPSAELEADTLGLELMARAGYDVSAAASALYALGIQGVEATASHPSGAARLKALKDFTSQR